MSVRRKDAEEERVFKPMQDERRGGRFVPGGDVAVTQNRPELKPGEEDKDPKRCLASQECRRTKATGKREGASRPPSSGGSLEEKFDAFTTGLWMALNDQEFTLAISEPMHFKGCMLDVI
ncbi:hypothetical protein NDU88_003089 [Pleurodeles waltl]|uniref:Uncharacterized protein n=1 Tax=Pleurodeles waltl TaxID=8319 RepID=A0AAV7WRE6_PLEWA|nr:hypothetical protein NDU88_003089 [Pleurodeles waltl]